MSQDKVNFDKKLDGYGLRVGVVQSRFNAQIVDALAEGCIAELKRLGVEEIEHVKVPGALEIPVTLQVMAMTERFDCLVALGCVVRGETYHFELVCNDSGRGVMDVQLTTGVPVANAILTVENDEQARARLDKGVDAARVAIEMATTLRRLQR
ncbi:MAG TPA: 6,7-dimethyl-8-ribityllumazine synthase [Burkholderiales bacterium]|jgi:6,7-dimethyl-8-ribityllumazine synthase